MKKHCDGKFVKTHTRDGTIRAQLKDAQGDDDPFITIQTPDDIHKLGIDVNLQIINDKYVRFKVQGQIDIISTHNRYQELLDEIQDELV